MWMAVDNKRNQDPGNTNPPLSDSDLEQYGVWVKGEPQEVPLDGPEVELSIPDIESTEIEDESFLTKEEESVFEDESDVFGTSSAAESGGDSTTAEFDAVSIDDFLENEAPPADSPLPVDSSVEEEPLDMDLQFDDSLPASVEGVSAETSSFDSVDFGIETEEISDMESFDLESTSKDMELDESKLDISLDDLPEIDIDSIGTETENAEESVSLEESAMEESTLPTSERDLTEIEMEEPAPEEKEELPELEIDETAVGQSDRPADAGSIGQRIAGSEGKLAETEKTVLNEEVSTQILLKIANDLSSIREELSSLKAQLADLKIERTSPSIVEEAVEEKKVESTPLGFFDEEEDETIALTGDELDNILNTANFTEETGEGVSETDERFIMPQQNDSSADLLSDDILAESSDQTIVFPVPAESVLPSADTSDLVIEEVSLDEPPLEEPSIVEEGSLDIENVAVLPNTVDDIDTSYLEEEEATLDEPPLEEPDLSGVALQPDEESFAPNLEEGDEFTLDISSPNNAGLSAFSPRLSPGDEPAFLPPEASVPSPEPEEPKGPESVDLFDEGELSILEESDQPPEIVEQESQFIPSAEGPVFTEEQSAEPEEMTAVEEELETLEGIELPGSETTLPEIEEIPSIETVEPTEELEESIEPAPEEIQDTIEISIPEPMEPVRQQEAVAETPVAEAPTMAAKSAQEVPAPASVPGNLKDEIKSVLTYLDKLLESLPDDKIEEFAKSDQFDVYKKLFEELGLV
jgi:pilus assembly protein FimV